jgi:polyisoprenoid-binding protein YceI
MKNFKLAVYFSASFFLVLTPFVWAGDSDKAKPVLVTTPLAGPVDSHSNKPALNFKPGTELWLEGNSTLHRFYFTATQVSASSEVDTSDTSAKTLLSQILKKKIHRLVVTVPVEGLKSGEEGMDKNAYGCLKSKDFPDIVFRMEEYEVKAFPGNPDAYAILAKGKMKIAGQEKDIVLDATMINGPDGIVIYGNQDILQKDYGIAPFSMAIVMTVDNKIVVHYAVKLGSNQAE